MDGWARVGEDIEAGIDRTLKWVGAGVVLLACVVVDLLGRRHRARR